jgi:hypothetical protein
MSRVDTRTLAETSAYGRLGRAKSGHVVNLRVSGADRLIHDADQSISAEGIRATTDLSRVFGCGAAQVT